MSPLESMCINYILYFLIIRYYIGSNIERRHKKLNNPSLVSLARIWVLMNFDTILLHGD